MNRFTRSRSIAVAACVALVCGACGGSNPSGPSPSGSTSSTTSGGGTTTGTTITITPAGVSPKSVTVASGSSVTFINNDNQPHDMSSDPHPQHNDCPEMNGVGFIQPGQTKSTNAFRTVRTCGFHDHNQPSTVALQGTIVIQ
ncbi:MAG: hypothetical protein ABL982_25465 [Vicinamibacterales bacterium]